jgi:tetratricopeptide (TPR) repeat protein
MRIQAVAAGLVLLMPILVVTYPVIADDARSLAPTATNSSNVISANPATSDADISSEEEIRRLFDLYRDARSPGMLEEADTLAKRIVDLSIRAYGIDNKVTALALTNLAALQSSNEDNVSAVQNFAQAIEIVERLDSRLSSDLISPLRGMGAAYLLAGNADHAQAAWNRALHISHVNFGPHNFEQIETLYSLGRSFMNAGMTKEVIRVRKRISFLRYRNANSGSIGELPEP